MTSKCTAANLTKSTSKFASDMIALAGVHDIVQIVQGTSTDSLRKLKEEGKINKIDVLFLDHFQQYYLTDLQICEDVGLFHKGSIVLADNMDLPDPPEYIKYVSAGGRGGEGNVKFKTKSVKTSTDPARPNSVEVTTVVSVPNV